MHMNQGEQLRTDGYCIFSNLFNKSFINELRLHFQKRVHEQKNPFDTIAMDYRPEYMSLYIHPCVVKVLREELGCPDPKFHASYFINKNPGESRRSWHHDWYAWDEPLSTNNLGPQIGLMVYFNPTNECNGCLEVIPKSHRVWQNDYFTDYQLYMKPHPDSVQVISNPGDLVIVDARTFHATKGNTSQEARMMCTMWYFTNWKSMTAKFRAYRATRDEYVKKLLGDFYPCSDVPFYPDYPSRIYAKREEMI